MTGPDEEVRELTKIIKPHLSNVAVGDLQADIAESIAIDLIDHNYRRREELDEEKLTELLDNILVDEFHPQPPNFIKNLAKEIVARFAPRRISVEEIEKLFQQAKERAWGIENLRCGNCIQIIEELKEAIADKMEEMP